MLLAEDNALVCEAMCVLLEETGHRVTTAGLIGEVVRVAETEQVDLLLLDLGLADGDGLEVLSRLATSGRTPRVVVALTGRDEPEIVARCLAAGCREVLLKPVPARELLAKVRDWVAE